MENTQTSLATKKLKRSLSSKNLEAQENFNKKQKTGENKSGEQRQSQVTNLNYARVFAYSAIAISVFYSATRFWYYNT